MTTPILGEKVPASVSARSRKAPARPSSARPITGKREVGESRIPALPSLISLKWRIAGTRRRDARVGALLAVPLAAQPVASAQHIEDAKIVVLRQRLDALQVLRYGLLHPLQFGGRRQAELDGPERGVVAQLPQAGGALK